MDRVAGIYMAEPLSAADRACVADLQDGMKKLFGSAPRLLAKAPKAGKGPVMLLGKAAGEQSGKITEAEMNAAGPDGYVVRCDGEGVVIAGADAWTTRWGVYAFLERLGLGYFQPSPGQAQVVGSKPKREIEPFSITERPCFAYRSGWAIAYRESWPQLADPHKGLNPELFTKEAGSDLWLDHSAGYLVPRALYAKDHPEYYAMGKNGKRVTSFTDHRTPLCLSNPDVTRIAIERALAWVEREPEKKYFMITNGDTRDWCQCPNCLALDPVPGESATRLLSWVNPIARAVAARFPDKIVLTFAYAGSDVAPPRIRPETNVWVVGSTGLGNVYFWEHAMGDAHPGADDHNLKKIDGWLAVAPRQYLVCEYLGRYEPCLVDNMAARLRYYEKRGLKGIYATYGHPANFPQLWEYVFSRLMWNPKADAEALANDYIRCHYGKAAEPIARFFKISHQRYQATLRESGRLASAGAYPSGLYASDFIGEAQACFAAAERRAAGDPELKREIEAEKREFSKDVAGHLPTTDHGPRTTDY